MNNYFLLKMLADDVMKQRIADAQRERLASLAQRSSPAARRGRFTAPTARLPASVLLLRIAWRRLTTYSAESTAA